MSKVCYLGKMCESLLQKKLQDTGAALFIQSSSHRAFVELSVTSF